MCTMETYKSINVDHENTLVREREHKNRKFRALPLCLSINSSNCLTADRRIHDEPYFKNTVAGCSLETSNPLANNLEILEPAETPFSDTCTPRSCCTGDNFRKDPFHEQANDETSLKSNDDTVFSQEEGRLMDSKFQFVQNGTRFALQCDSRSLIENSGKYSPFCHYDPSSESLNSIGARDHTSKFSSTVGNHFDKSIGARLRGKSHTKLIRNTPHSLSIDANTILHDISSRKYKEPSLILPQNTLVGKSSSVNEDDWLSDDNSAFLHSNDIYDSRFVCTNAKTVQEVAKPNSLDSLEVKKVSDFSEIQTCIDSDVQNCTEPQLLRYKKECFKVMTHNSLDRTASSNKKSSPRRQNIGNRAEISETAAKNLEASGAGKFLDPNFAVKGENKSQTKYSEGKAMLAEVSLENSHDTFKDANRVPFNPRHNTSDSTWFSHDLYEFDSNCSDNYLTDNVGEDHLEYKFESLNINLDDEKSNRSYVNTRTSPSNAFPQPNSSTRLSNYRAHRPVNIKINTRYTHNSHLPHHDLKAESSVTGWPYSTYSTGIPESSTFMDSSEMNDILNLSNNASSIGTMQKSEAFGSDILNVPVNLPPASAYYQTESKKNAFLKSPVQGGAPLVKNHPKSGVRYNTALEDVMDDNDNHAFSSISQHYEFRNLPTFDCTQSLDAATSRFISKSGLLSAPVSHTTSTPTHRMCDSFERPPIGTRPGDNRSFPNNSAYFSQHEIKDRLKDTFVTYQRDQLQNNYYANDCAVVRPSVEFGSKSANIKMQTSQSYRAYSQCRTAIPDMVRISHPMIPMQSDLQFEHNRNYNSYGSFSSWMAPSVDTLKARQNLSLKSTSRGMSSRDDNKNPLLEEIKMSKNSRIELRNILGSIVEFSCDQHGSRFIQQKIQSATAAERQAVFEEILPSAFQLMTDVFGNYVIQKFFEYGTQKQRELLTKKMEGNVLSLSLHVYGCRVVQKALECVSHAHQSAIVRELEGNVIRCIKDQNGNHVIQKAIELVPAGRIESIINAFVGQVVNLATHPYGCRVVQRAIQHLYDDSEIGSGISDMDDIPELEQKRRSRDIWRAVKKPMLNELLKDIIGLIQNQYGNYVVQHVLERGGPTEKSLITKEVCAQVLQLSRHKFASNVVEKCVTYGSKEDRELLIDEVLRTRYDGTFPLVTMMKDQFANYVVQKMLEASEGKQREEFTNKIKPHLQFLKKYSYGRHLTAKVEKIVSTQNNDNNSSSQL